MRDIAYSLDSGQLGRHNPLNRGYGYISFMGSIPILCPRIARVAQLGTKLKGKMLEHSTERSNDLGRLSSKHLTIRGVRCVGDSQLLSRAASI